MPIYIQAQTPSIDWQNTISGINDDEVNEFIKTDDGGYFLAGHSNSYAGADKSESPNGEYDFWVIKVNSLGNIQWEKTIGGQNIDWLHAAAQTNDGGFILGGFSNSDASGDKSENSKGSFDYWIVKLDASGNIQWDRTIGGDDADQIDSIIQTPDGGYVAVEGSKSNISGEKTENAIGDKDFWVVKLNASGTIMWQNTIGGAGPEYEPKIINTPDGGFMLGGTSSSDISGDKTENSNGASDAWILKLDNNGQIQWQNTIGGSSSEFFQSIIKIENDGYLLSTTSFSDISGDKTENSKGGPDGWLLKLDEQGAIEWQKTIGGNSGDFLHHTTPYGNGYLLALRSGSNISGDKSENSRGQTDYWVVSLDSNRNVLWDKTLGGDQRDVTESIVVANDGGIVIAGTSLSTASGDKTENSMGYDMWLVKLEAALGIEDKESMSSLSIYPNPTTNSIRISLENEKINEIDIITIQGKIVEKLNNLSSSVEEINVSHLPAGVYFISVSSSHQKSLKKFIKK